MRKDGDSWKDEKREEGEIRGRGEKKKKREKNCWEWPVSWEAQEASGSSGGAPGGHLSSATLPGATTTH